MKKNVIVKFKDEGHTYWHGNTQYLSVNKLLSNFGFYFNRPFWLVYKGLGLVVENMGVKYFSRGFDFEYSQPEPDELAEAFAPDIEFVGAELDLLIKEISNQWEMSSILGTKFHSEQEDLAYENGFIINPYDGKKYIIQEKPRIPKGFDNVSSHEYLYGLMDGAYAELLVFLKKYKIAGQADEVFIETIDGVRYVDIGDHKTNGKKPANTKKNGTCYHPIDHLLDNTHVKYQLQASMYAHILSHYGYTPRNVGYYHYKDYDFSTRKVYKLKYLGKECSDILHIHLENM